MRIAAVLLSAGLLAASLDACTPEYFPEAHGEGDSLQQNFMAQAVNPMPNQATQAPDQNGQRASDAFERYREGKVIKPVGITTSQTSTGGSSGGSK